MNNILLWRYISFKIINLQYTVTILLGFAIGISSIILVTLLLNAYISFTENKLLGITPHITLDVNTFDSQAINNLINKVSDVSGVNVVNKAIYIEGNAILGGVLSGAVKNPGDTDIFIKGINVLSFKDKYSENNKQPLLMPEQINQIVLNYNDVFSNDFLNEFNNDFSLLQKKKSTMSVDQFIEKYHLILDRTVTHSSAVDFEKNLPRTTNISSLSYDINNRIIIDRNLATKLFYAPLNSGDEIVIKFNNLYQGKKKLFFEGDDSYVFKTAGLIDADKEGQGIILTSIKSIKKLLPNAKVNIIEVSIHNPYELYSIISKIKKIDNTLIVNNWKEDRSGIFAILSSLDLLVFIVSILILSITSFSLYSTLHITISEQRKTICFLKSIGVNDLSVLLWFLGYGLFVSIISILLSILFSFVIVNLSSFINNEVILELLSYINYDALFSKEALFKMLFIIAIILSSSIIPSYKASKLNPATGLKEN